MEEVLAELGENVASRHDLVSPDSGACSALGVAFCLQYAVAACYSMTWSHPTRVSEVDCMAAWLLQALVCSDLLMSLVACCGPPLYCRLGVDMARCQHACCRRLYCCLLTCVATGHDLTPASPAVTLFAPAQLSWRRWSLERLRC